ncbi:hypothetical protein F2981_11445 [Sinorhizobium meliloti]|nr:hypothetical protein [Sinorhizobium meliloti]
MRNSRGRTSACASPISLPRPSSSRSPPCSGRKAAAGHFRADCPDERPEWRRRTYLTLAQRRRLAADVAESEPA